MKTLKTWTTDPNGDRLERRKTVFFRKRSQNTDRIVVRKDERFQSMDGFGFSLTGGSAYHIMRLPAKKRKALLKELFSKSGIGVSALRLTIGASDLDMAPYSYADTPSDDLANFDLFAGGKEVVPLLQEILKIAPDIRIFASPWSAPPWMKTNNSFVSGRLKNECYSVYAEYFVRYILAMREQGINVYGVTVQNEPLNDLNEPSMLMDPSEQIDFVGNHLGPVFRDRKINTKIYCWDHNCDRPDYVLRVLKDEKAREYVNGSAWHLYGGSIDILDYIHEEHPEHEIIFTEQWVAKKSDFGGNLSWHAKNIIIGAPRNFAKAVFEWNLANDPECNPHTEKGCAECLGALTIDENGEVTRNVAYYLIAHASKFVPLGSHRIGSNVEKGLPNVAYETSGGKLVLIVFNEEPQLRSFAIQEGEYFAEVSLPAGTLATYMW
ncbi:MAG: glycoside hydrolase family 30 beta sandwich domain-containing protein [Candidatus Paceibacterota bacterium]|jgi:glucosylceramidase|nr:glucosylceramidase [Candidatus Paceibacterota bacterium]